ncbi:hypothetical protein ACIBG8_42760 [Nonomuraea sp. NPDC050556]|uniref:hypothetical protein n=1 Tax=Nonomuraea sp. NPDC050556 TaxID=3364369 RepID=UPI0037B5E515
MDFADAWARYCPDPGGPAMTAETGVENGDVLPFARGSRTGRTSVDSAGQSGTAHIPGTA